MRAPFARHRFVSTSRLRLASALLVLGAAASTGCRGHNLIGGAGGGGGGTSGGPGGSLDAGVTPSGDGKSEPPDASPPMTDAANDPRPEFIDPQVSRAWTWQSCGAIAAAEPDTAAVIDPQGNIAVLGPRGVRLYDAGGNLLPAASGPADFLIAGPDGAPLAGTITASAIVMTPIGAVTPLFTFALPKSSKCGNQVSFSAQGDYLLAHGAGPACIWRVADQALVGNVANVDTSSLRVGLRGAGLVTVEAAAGSTTNVVTRDFAGRETARVTLPAAANWVYLSPSGDRLFLSATLWNVADGTSIPLKMSGTGSSATPIFSPTGERVLLGGGVFRTSDGLLEQAAAAGSIVSQVSGERVVLSPDGRLVVDLRLGRATLFDISSVGVAAVLGPPLTPGTASNGVVDYLALSSDQSLLVANLEAAGAFGLRVAPSFAASKVIWSAYTEINLVVDVSPDNQLVAIAGDGRVLLGAADGRTVWAGQPPPAGVGPGNCLPERLRFSPKRTWVAGNGYDRTVDVFAVGDATAASAWNPVVSLAAGCSAVAFSRDERLMVTSGAALYQTGPTGDAWRKVWSADAPMPPPETIPPANGFLNDVAFSPDEAGVLVSWCGQDRVCATNLLDARTGILQRALPHLQAPHPSFSPDGSWIIAGGTLVHLASGDLRSLEASGQTKVALFTSNGDIIAGSADNTLTRYCRSP